MRRFLIGVVAAAALAWPIGVQANLASPAHTIKAYGELDCNGLSRNDRPIAPNLPCADPHRIEDNGRYVGHDEPTIGFFSSARDSSTNLQWEIKLSDQDIERLQSHRERLGNRGETGWVFPGSEGNRLSGTTSVIERGTRSSTRLTWCLCDSTTYATPPQRSVLLRACR